MTDYILQNHQGDSGIVYCLSKKVRHNFIRMRVTALIDKLMVQRHDAETVAQGLRDESSGRIRTGVYHADVHDVDKERLHQRWRTGDVKVVCATIGKYCYDLSSDSLIVS